MRTMRWIAIVSAICVLSCARVAREEVCRDAAAPSERLVVRPGAVALTPTFADLGDIPWGRAVPISLALAKNSSDPIEISHVGADCDCAVPARPYEGVVVPAGASTLMEFHVHVGFEPGVGERRLRVALRSGQAFISLVRANVIGTYTVPERVIDYGDVDIVRCGVLRRLVHFVSTETELLDARPDCDWINATFAPSPDGAELAIQVLPDRLDNGVSYGALVLTTTDADRPTLRISVRANGVADIVPVPSSLYFRQGDSAVVQFRDRTLRKVDAVWCEAEVSLVTGAVLTDGRLAVASREGWGEGARARIRVGDQSGRVGFVSIDGVRD